MNKYHLTLPNLGYQEEQGDILCKTYECRGKILLLNLCATNSVLPLQLPAGVSILISRGTQRPTEILSWAVKIMVCVFLLHINCLSSSVTQKHGKISQQMTRDTGKAIMTTVSFIFSLHLPRIF